MNKTELRKILEDHKKWQESNGGQRANLMRVNLMRADLIRANLRGANLREANLRGTDLRETNLRGADLRGADLREADLRGADLRGANLRETNLMRVNLMRADLIRANLRETNLRGADLRGADLREADLRGADLREADLSGANLREADLSNSQGLLVAVDYMAENFTKNENGYIAYKQFNMHRVPNPEWKIEAGSIIGEVVNPNRTDDCGCGVNVGTKKWVADNFSLSGSRMWKCLIRWEWLPGVVVPYNTDGKIRCEKVELICEIDGWEGEE